MGNLDHADKKVRTVKDKTGGCSGMHYAPTDHQALTYLPALTITLPLRGVALV